MAIFRCSNQISRSIACTDVLLRKKEVEDWVQFLIKWVDYSRSKSYHFSTWIGDFILSRTTEKFKGVSFIFSERHHANVILCIVCKKWIVWRGLMDEQYSTAEQETITSHSISWSTDTRKEWGVIRLVWEQISSIPSSINVSSYWTCWKCTCKFHFLTTIILLL